LACVGDKLGLDLLPEDFLAYVAAVVAHPEFTRRFSADLSTPGLRIPITVDATMFAEGVELGRTSDMASHVRRSSV
jgi:hypothetical protein